MNMSKPTHLLCVASNKRLVDDNRAMLNDHGWKIEDI